MGKAAWDRQIMAANFDPYHLWLGIPAEEQPANHYRLLGIPLLESDPDVIEHAADQRMQHLRTLQTSPHAPLSQRLLNEVAAARVCLLNQAKKAAYDAELRASPAVSRPAAADVPAGAGSEFGDYLLLEEIGRGGTGPVYKARHCAMGRIVAIKMLSPETARVTESIARFQRKTKIVAKLNHPNLVVAHDAGQHGGRYYLVMEYFPSHDLAAVVRQHGPLSIPQAIRYVVQAAAGLRHAHAQGVLHRNMKPGNLLVNEQGVVKVIGLGRSRLFPGSEHLSDSAGVEITAPRHALGTLDFMAPEQAFDARLVDQRADIYSLGCTLCSLLTGQPPYPLKSQMQKVLAHRSAEIPSLQSRRSDVPEALDALFQSMLAKRREDRPASMDEVICRLA